MLTLEKPLILLISNVINIAGSELLIIFFIFLRVLIYVFAALWKSSKTYFAAICSACTVSGIGPYIVSRICNKF
jgi:hypothetical protein